MAQKLKTFEVDVQETSYGSLRVKAASVSDAIEKAQEALAEGEVVWGGKIYQHVGDSREVAHVNVMKKRKVQNGGVR